MPWVQRHITLPPFPRGFHLVTGEIISKMPEIGDLSAGVMHVFIQHTSASLSINENADPSVRTDMETHFNVMVPEDATHFEHTIEGPDDMTSHIKASLLGSSVTVPISNGALALGMWQGVYLCEHRNRGGARRIVVTLGGE